jgi:hypothetical protein
MLLQLGGLRLLGVPGEPTLGAARKLEEHAKAARAVGLTGGYVGYVELADRVRERVGESHRQYYGPELLPQLERAADALAHAAAHPAESEGPPPGP